MSAHGRAHQHTRQLLVGVFWDGFDGRARSRERQESTAACWMCLLLSMRHAGGGNGDCGAREERKSGSSAFRRSHRLSTPSLFCPSPPLQPPGAGSSTCQIALQGRKPRETRAECERPGEEGRGFASRTLFYWQGFQLMKSE